MLQTASGDDPKIAQNSNTSKIASRRPRIAPRRLQDGQDAQTDPNRTPKTTPNKSPNRRNMKVNCDMMIVQITQKSQCKTIIFDIQNIVLRPFLRLRIDQGLIMSQRGLRTAPKNRCLGPLGPSWSLLGRFMTEIWPILGPQSGPTSAQHRPKTV